MSGPVVEGDQVSCSRVGGAMRRESSRLRQHAQSLNGALAELAGWTGPEADAARAAIVDALRALRATVDDLDEAGAALQRYATDLAEAHELGRRAEVRVQEAGLLMDGTRVVEPWGPADSQEAEMRRAQLPAVQARVDLATACAGRARGRLGREMTRLAQCFSDPSRGSSDPSRATDPARIAPLPPL
jgi:hypothetical protein